MLEKKATRIVMGLVGHDTHVVANRIFAVVLEEEGFQVCNLGTSNRLEDFVAAIQEVEAHAVLMSSLNGEAENWCPAFRGLLSAAGYGDVLLYIGGNLVVGEADEATVIDRFRSWGFDRVFYGATDFNQVVNLLRQDLSNGKSLS